MGEVFALQMQEPYEEVVNFDDFWILQVRKEAKKDARKAWDKLKPEQQALAVIGSADWRVVWLARDDTRYIPLPASWLNGERFEDELPAEFRRRVPSREVARPEDKGKYVPMPEHVRALLAKLRGK